MNYLIASDLHGSARFTRQLFRRAEAERPDRILLLGDLLYHGPRNDLPEEYRPKEVLSLLNAHAKELLCVRGNCDCEVDQMVLQFPILADYAVLETAGRLFYLAHGHHPELLEPLLPGTGAVLLTGHTHLPLCEEKDGFLHCNPGSVSIPKGDSLRSYMTLCGALLQWKALDSGEVYREYAL